MFGCCVAGRLLQTNLQQVDESHAMFEVPHAESINHMCVFLLGTVPFPNGYGATVHFFWPGKGFQLLGMLSNDKPSAIFRLKGTFTSQTASEQAHPMFTAAAGFGVTTILWISIEPLSQISQQVSSLPSAVATRSAVAPDATVLAERIVKHLFNYISGFVTGGSVTEETTVPMGVIARWYGSFLAKAKAGGIGFLENQS
ncbi:DUF775-domain-containing protein [Cristinia sonorae]|uniref:DUF775-domain-containing protein n=1 Tax=Cristinia sonorae TaxID=1940300 RepID=A0A8K0UF49_9AGAR|nr:DUF775-domain-containing protein [Cristinia sonorae]